MKKMLILKQAKESPKTWHYETEDLQALCRPADPLGDRVRSVSNSTPNIKYVTCRKCLKLLRGERR